MNKQFGMLALGIGVLCVSCTKLSEPVDGYFYGQNLGDETYTLFINGKNAGTLPENPMAAIPCIDSTLTHTTYYQITNKRNKYQLKNASGEVVAKGNMHLRNNGSVSSGSTADLGPTLFFMHQNVMVLGFNTESPNVDYGTECFKEE